MSKSKILFIMTGSIACYKACQVVSRLVQNDCDVQVVATPSALQFVGNATFEGLTGKSVVSDMYAPGSVMDHIHLMRWADVVVVAPATAHFINKSALGLGDDLVGTLFLAHDFKKPFLIAPAMNTSMYLHPTTQASLQKLRAMGCEILDAASGILACGEEGYGRLLEPELIQKHIFEALQKPLRTSGPSVPPKKALRILVTAGGTQEPIDNVRAISNSSTGTTGVRLAEAFQDLGCDVTLLRAETAAATNLIQKQQSFTSFSSLQDLLRDQLQQNDFTHVIHLAAVSDYSLRSIEMDGRELRPGEQNKIKSDADEVILHLKRNPKLVDVLKDYSRNKDLKVVAFKLTSQASAAEKKAAVDKLFAGQKVDWVVHNDLSEIDRGQKQHKFTLHQRDRSVVCENLDQLIVQLSSQIIPEVIL